MLRESRARDRGRIPLVVGGPRLVSNGLRGRYPIGIFDRHRCARYLSGTRV